MLIVKKFGGTSVGDKQRMYNVANRCIEEYKKGNDVVVVLSAMGKYTDELISKAATYEESCQDKDEKATLSGFLEEVALVADIDSLDEDQEYVVLMTLHSAKGLEFPRVYLAGMEDG